MNSNREYWTKRYGRVGGPRTVGENNWTASAYNDAKQRFVDLMEKQLPKLWSETEGSTLLEFGCGIGRWAGFMRSKGIVYYGCDIVGAALEQAREANPSCTFGKAEGATLPCEFPQKFDMVFTCVALQHIVDPALFSEVVETLKGVLAPGGVFILHENVTRAASNHYIAFRSEGEYLEALDGLSPHVVTTHREWGESSRTDHGDEAALAWMLQRFMSCAVRGARWRSV